MAHRTFFHKLFIAAALWNLSGAILGYFNTGFTFEFLFNRELEDPLMYTIYKGSWGTTLTYFIGYLIVARNPSKHYGIVIIGGIGKLGYVVNLIQLYLSGLAAPIVFVIVLGDSLFLILFACFFYHLLKSDTVVLRGETSRH